MWPVLKSLQAGMHDDQGGGGVIEVQGTEALPSPFFSLLCTISVHEDYFFNSKEVSKRSFRVKNVAGEGRT